MFSHSFWHGMFSMHSANQALTKEPCALLTKRLNQASSLAQIMLYSILPLLDIPENMVLIYWMTLPWDTTFMRLRHKSRLCSL